MSPVSTLPSLVVRNSFRSLLLLLSFVVFEPLLYTKVLYSTEMSFDSSLVNYGSHYLHIEPVFVADVNVSCPSFGKNITDSI